MDQLEGILFCGCSDFARLLEGISIITTFISYNKQSLEVTKLAIKWIIIPKNVINLSWVTFKFKLGKNNVLFPLIMHRKSLYNFVSTYVKDSK